MSLMLSSFVPPRGGAPVGTPATPASGPSHPLRFVRSARLGLFLAVLSTSFAAQAQRASSYTQFLGTASTAVLLADWTCTRGDGKTCTSGELANPDIYRQLLVLPTGYLEGDRTKFFTDADLLRTNMSDVPGSTVYSEVHKQRILYIAYFVAGGALSSATSAFGGKVFAHPVRGKALTQDQNAVYAFVAQKHATTFPQLSPSAVATIFNTYEGGITANATPPSFSGRAYGVARMTAGDVQGTYVGAHEVGHALLSWVDEYVESGFENMSITQADVLTPLALWDGGFGTLGAAVGNLLGFYDLRISEILANNGSDNVALSSTPATVSSAAPGSETYEYEGGLFFGRGTWHDRGNNLMNSNFVKRGADDGFGYDHSASQQRVVASAFAGGSGRANDRLRNAGPNGAWKLQFGSNTDVMMFDGDKNHRWHPTQSYEVQVGWYERVWKTCWAAFIPYPCYDNVWKTAQKTVAPSRDTVQLKASSAFGLASFAQKVVCGLGLGGLAGAIDVCTLTVDQMASAFVPTLTFYLPYQHTSVPASQWFTTYFWRFRTYNGTHQSGFTNWSSFYRSL